MSEPANITAPAVFQSPYFTGMEAAAYLRISYSTFRKKARLIRQCPGTRRYTREALDEFANNARPRRKR